MLLKHANDNTTYCILSKCIYNYDCENCISKVCQTTKDNFIEYIQDKPNIDPEEQDITFNVSEVITADNLNDYLISKEQNTEENIQNKKTDDIFDFNFDFDGLNLDDVDHFSESSPDYYREKFIEDMKTLYPYPEFDFDYSEMEYVNRLTKVTIFCRKHNNYFTGKPDAMKSGSAICIDCNKIIKSKKKEENRKNRESIFIVWLKENKPHYKYIGGFTKDNEEVILFCTIHNCEFKTTPVYLKTRNKHCPECYELFKEENNEEDKKYREQEFIEWLAINRPYYKYISGFNKDNEEVILYCTLHDIKFSIKPVYLKQNTTNCPECRTIENKTKKEEDRINRENIFIEWLKENKPHYKYISGFTGNKDEVTLYCTIHATEFSIKPDYLKQNMTNCSGCNESNKQEYTESYRLKREQMFIDWLKENFPEYEYVSGFTGNKDDVTLYCVIHEKEFQVKLDYLKQKKTMCPDCQLLHKQDREEQSRRLREQDFIDWLAINRPEYEYRYGFIVDKDNLVLFCKTHKVLFVSNPSNLKNNNATLCPLCKKEINLQKLAVDRDIRKQQFIKDSIEVWGDGKFDYSLVDFTNQRNEVKIRCMEHDCLFEQIPSSHILGQIGCPICKERQRQERTERERVVFEQEFYKKAKEKHGDKYDYSSVVYINSSTLIEIYCKKHKKFFKQTPSMHLSGEGCPICNESKLESVIKKILEDNNIVYEIQKTFDWLIFKRKQKLDFYLPDYNIAIECQGSQHFKPVSFSSDESKMFEQFELNQARDLNKKKLCEEHGVPIIYIANKSYCDNITIFEISELINQIENHKNKK